MSIATSYLKVSDGDTRIVNQVGFVHSTDMWVSKVTVGLGERISTQMENDVFAVNVQFSHPIQGNNLFFRRSLFSIAIKTDK